MNRLAAAGDAARRALQALAGFVSSVRVDFGDLTQRLDMEKEPGLADSGALDSDLSALLQAAGEAARSGSGSTGWPHRKNSICEPWPRSAPALTVPAGSRSARQVRACGRADPREADQERDGVQPRPRRHRLHGAVVRRVSVTDHAGCDREIVIAVRQMKEDIDHDP